MSEEPCVLSANAAFYNAFASCNIQAMEDLWSKDSIPTCIHPGWTPLVGLKSVLKSWRDILIDGSISSIKCTDARAFIYDDYAYVICREHIELNVLIATNIFLKEDGKWKIVHHQASPTLSISHVSPTHKTLQ